MEPHSSPAAGRGSFLSDVARTALGVFIGGLAALFAHDAIVGPQPSPPTTPAVAMPSKPVGDDSSGTAPGTQAAAQAVPAPPAAAPIPPPPAAPDPSAPPPAPPAPPQAEAPPPMVAPEPAPKKADDDLKTAQALAARLEAERQQRRADAWARFFQPSPVCRADPTTRPCADAHLAARKRFDAQYVDR